MKKTLFEAGKAFSLTKSTDREYRYAEDRNDRDYLEVYNNGHWEFALWIDAILPGRIILYGPHGLLIPIDYSEMIFNPVWPTQAEIII